MRVPSGYYPVTDKVVLDLGCGRGSGSVLNALFGAKRVLGVDIDKDLVCFASSYTSRKGIDQTDYIVADGASLPLKDESIDAIYSCDLIEHLATPKKVLQEAKRVLKSGGVFLITFPIYYSQQGAHLYDYINIPWCPHYKHLVQALRSELALAISFILILRSLVCPFNPGARNSRVLGGSG
jgi:ubiquinone/menaquinone biosynthesis C-methylase UbiE